MSVHPPRELQHVEASKIISQHGASEFLFALQHFLHENGAALPLKHSTPSISSNASSMISQQSPKRAQTIVMMWSGLRRQYLNKVDDLRKPGASTLR